VLDELATTESDELVNFCPNHRDSVSGIQAVWQLQTTVERLPEADEVLLAFLDVERLLIP
jgi:hypothetical protein